MAIFNSYVSLPEGINFFFFSLFLRQIPPIKRSVFFLRAGHDLFPAPLYYCKIHNFRNMMVSVFSCLFWEYAPEEFGEYGETISWSLGKSPTPCALVLVNGGFTGGFWIDLNRTYGFLGCKATLPGITQPLPDFQSETLTLFKNTCTVINSTP